MKKTVVIVGGSAGARIVEEIFSNLYSEIVFLETYANGIDSKKIIGKSIIDGIEILNKDSVDYFIATGDNLKRMQNYNLIFTKTQKNPVNCIHPSAFVSPSARLGFGNLVCPLSVIHTNATVNNNTIINTGAIIEHDCEIDDYAQISPNTTLCGRVKVGKFAFVGAGSVVIPEINIGKNSVVAAGSSVTHDIEENTMYAGVPAIKKKSV